MDEERSTVDKEMELLQKVEKGEISADEASRVLDEYSDEVNEDTIGDRESLGEQFTPYGNWTNWWVFPYTIGVVTTVLGSIWLYSSWMANPFGLGFWLAWIPFTLGIILMSLSWQSRTAHWIHVRVKNKNKNWQRISISLPIPLRFIKWIVVTFGNYMPNEVRGVDLDDFLDEIEATVSSENPIYIWVDDEKEKVQVEVWIGGGAASRS